MAAIPRHHYKPTAAQRAELQAFRERLAQLRAQRAKAVIEFDAVVSPEVQRALHELRRLMGAIPS